MHTRVLRGAVIGGVIAMSGHMALAADPPLGTPTEILPVVPRSPAR